MSILRFRSLASLGSKIGASGSQVKKMGSNIHLPRDAGALNFLHRREKCQDSAASNTCEKPVGSSGETLTIVLGIVIPVVAAIIVLIFLHRRNLRREALEDAHDPNQGLDFGLDEAEGKGRARKSLMYGGGGGGGGGGSSSAEKGAHKGTQLSMDMNLSSPYLLPPGAQGSRDSIARTLQSEQDPYRHIAQYTTSDSGSIKSVNPDSPFTPRNGGGNKPGKNLEPLKMPPRAGGNPRSPSQHAPYTPRTPRSPEEKDDPFASPSTPKAVHQLPEGVQMHDSHLPVQAVVPEIDTVSPGGFNADDFEMPDLPPPVASRNHPDGASQMYPPHNHHAHSDDHDGLGLDLDIPSILAPGPLPHELEHGPLYDQHGNQPQMRPPRQQQQQQQQHEAHGRDERGRALRRPPPPPDGPMKPRGLNVPQSGAKRTSVGNRPLPPNEVMQSDDPETRANRIRSFYKEYFDESKQPAPPMPAPSQPSQKTEPAKQPTTLADYLADDDDDYLGDAAYYDASTNTFIMPYAQPVTRRAMTPPPANRTRDGPAPGGPPRGPHAPQGSVSGASLPGATRPRAGSAHDLRPGSSASARWNRGPPQKKLPPPSPLNTLPTPGKLKDDSFAIMGSIEFAPPTSIRDHVAGRSQSPLGERRPYGPKIPAASPLATAFEDLPVLPSPHMLRKSTAFTALDFAPPKKFKESGDTGASETGSLRSVRSGISAVQLNAIRSGAGRVSRLPGDTVFTQAAMDDQLKPQWGMRP